MGYWVYKVILFIVTILLCGWGCKSDHTINYNLPLATKPVVGDAVITHLQAEPISLNPTNWRDADANFILEQLFFPLLYKNPEAPTSYLPLLALNAPKVTNNGLSYTFQLNPKAQWDAQHPITAEDFAFTIKALLNPYVDCPITRSYVDNIVDVEIHTIHEFTVRLKGPYMLAEAILCEDIRPLPRHLLDPDNLLAKYSVHNLATTPVEVLKKSYPNLEKFAKFYNQINRQPNYLIGSGPYLLKEWKAQELIVLERKKDYWAETLDSLRGFQAYPKQLIFKVLPDFKSVYIALRNQTLDIVRNLPQAEFKAAQIDERITEHYHFYNPQMFACHFIGINNKPNSKRIPFFTDSLVRIAFNYLIDKNQIFQAIYHKQATPIQHFLSLYTTNDTFKNNYKYNIATADSLLRVAGWFDSDNDGLKDKVINGKKVQFEVEFAYNAGNDNRKNTGLILQAAAQKVGIKIDVVAYDWAVYNEKQQARDYDLFFGGWLLNNSHPDPKPLWHTQAAANVLGFGNTKTDSLIDSIRTCLVPKQRLAMYLRLAKMVHAQSPCIFLFAPHASLVIHKRFRNTTLYPTNPAFELKRFYTPLENRKYP